MFCTTHCSSILLLSLIAYDQFMNDKREDGFSSFIRATYSNTCQDDEEKKADKVVCETADNLIQARTQKYKQWLSNDPDPSTYDAESLTKEEFLSSRIHIKLESIVANPYDRAETKVRQSKYIRDPILDRCVKIREGDDFRPVIAHTKFGHVARLNTKIDPLLETREMLSRYTKDDLRFVLSQLDVEFEEEIGYDYAYVYELLNKH